MLTRKQNELLNYISNHMEKYEVPPSFDEMRNALGLASKSGIHRLVSGLEERGYIRRLANRARAIEIVKPIHNASIMVRAVEAATNLVTLPLLGRIAAGTPIEALRDSSRSFDVPPGMLGRGDHYALEIDGDSMIEAGILDGDVVLIKRTDTADNGEIVVALVEGHEATLKRLRRKGASIALEPANAAHETRIFGPDQVRVQGRLVGLVRQY